jgi:hypothetical protein
MIKRTCGPIYALVIASLIVPAVALALMAGRAPAAEPHYLESILELIQRLDMLHRSWFGTVDHYEGWDAGASHRWNGVWPDPWPDPPKRGILIYHEPGGVIKEHIERWRALARSGADVEILGPCYSACTLIVTYVPKERLCFGAFATLQFHLAWDRETGKPSLEGSLWMLKQYPREIYDWIMERGGVASMTIQTFRELRAPALWSMGYRQCERDQ